MGTNEARKERFLVVADKLLGRIEDLIDKEDAMDVKNIRSLTSAVKELKSIQDVQPEPEQHEQLAFDRMPEEFTV